MRRAKMATLKPIQHDSNLSSQFPHGAFTPRVYVGCRAYAAAKQLPAIAREAVSNED
jgi:hypothetical protein